MVSLRWRLGSPVWVFCFLSIARFSFTQDLLVLPRNWEIGFVSSSFSFRACRACRACGQGEAAWAHVQWCFYRWPSQVRVSRCSMQFSHMVCFYSHDFKEFVVLLFAFCLCFVVIYRFSGSAFLFDSTVLDEHELQKHFVESTFLLCQCQQFSFRNNTFLNVFQKLVKTKADNNTNTNNLSKHIQM